MQKFKKQLMSFVNNQILKSISYTIVSNIFTLLTSLLVVLIVPKYLTIEEYSYWQLYLFYSMFVGFLHFGWIDGIYLKYGGMDYHKLNKNLFFSQFYSLAVFQIVLSIFLIIGCTLFFQNQKLTVIQLIGVSLTLVNLANMIMFTLFATNKIKEASLISIIGKFVFLMLVFIAILSDLKNFQILIVADLIGKCITLFYGMYVCRDFIFIKMTNFSFPIKEAINNILVGINLLLANIASLLIVGTVRFGIENSWDITTFGKVSLALSLVNFILIFINAMGIVIYPAIRKASIENLPKIYISLREPLMAILLGLLLLFYPLKSLLILWLPKYVESYDYLLILLPIFIFEGKMALLINTYLKALRKERFMLKINLISFFLSVCVTYLTTVLINDLYLTVLSIVFLLALRSTLAEYYLLRKMKYNHAREINFEILLIVIFMILNWLLKPFFSFTIYLFIYLVYLFTKRTTLSNLYRMLFTKIYRGTL